MKKLLIACLALASIKVSLASVPTCAVEDEVKTAKQVRIQRSIGCIAGVLTFGQMIKLPINNPGFIKEVEGLCNHIVKQYGMHLDAKFEEYYNKYLKARKDAVSDPNSPSVSR